MFKKIIFILLLALLIFIGIDFYNSQKTVECWWGVMYPSLSFIAIEDEEDTSARKAMISSSDINYFYISEDEVEEEPIKFKIAIVEWFKKHFEKGE